MSSDHVERVARIDAMLDRCRDRGNVRLSHLEAARNELAELTKEHGAALNELERLRAERGEVPQPVPSLGQAYANGWYDALVHLRMPGWAEREAGWRKYMAEVEARAPQRPEHATTTCAFPGCVHPDHQAENADALKFAADMDRLRKADPGGAQLVEQILSERTGLSDRQAKLLAAIQREGGEWAPVRAQGVLTEAGYELTKERAHQIMKQLAERGYLEPVRPRAYTYRLKAEAPQQTENGSVK